MRAGGELGRVEFCRSAEWGIWQRGVLLVGGVENLARERRGVWGRERRRAASLRRIFLCVRCKKLLA